MKKYGIFLSVFLLMLNWALPALAAEGNVSYSGDAGHFVFAPGSEYSPTDLFPDFKDVMPGDSLTQKITLKNDASNKVKIRVYIRALGAHEGSEEFLSQLRLRVRVGSDNEMPYMFDAAAHETAQLTDWVCLGTLYSGGVVNLEVILDVPVELDNQYQQLVGYLDWEFMIEEYEIEPEDPEPPKTGDEMNPWFWFFLMILSLAGILLLLIGRKRINRED